MLGVHIPDVMNTGSFLEKRMTKVVEGHEEEGAINYNIQYLCESKEVLQHYQEKFAPKLQEEHGKRYKDKFIAFRTLLEVIE